MKKYFPENFLEVVKVFSKLGFLGFGGPAAHIALMHEEVVKKRKWLTPQKFLDSVGMTQLIPGPNSTELAIHLGYLRAGWPGFIAAGITFILPAMFLVMGISHFYVKFGTLPQVKWLTHFINPIVLAIIIQALWSLGKKTLKNKATLLISLLTFILFLNGINEIFLLILGGLMFLGITQIKKLPLFSVDLSLLFFTFLKIGSILYGSGYVLFALLQKDFVSRFGWISNQQLIDAIAIGQMTPGPLFTSATFIGYILGGVPGALVATAGIFLPAFLFTGLLVPFSKLITKSKLLRLLLNGVNAAALALMAAVCVHLGKSILIDPLSILLLFFSIILLFKFKISPIVLILFSVGIGFAIFIL